MILAVAAQLVENQCTSNHHYIFIFLNQKRIEALTHTEKTSCCFNHGRFFLQAATNCVESPALACTLASLLSQSGFQISIDGPSRDPWKPDWKLNNECTETIHFPLKKKECSWFLVACLYQLLTVPRDNAARKTEVLSQRRPRSNKSDGPMLL